MYKDDNDIPLWAKAAIYSMRSYGLIVGDENKYKEETDGNQVASLTRNEGEKSVTVHKTIDKAVK